MKLQAKIIILLAPIIIILPLALGWSSYLELKTSNHEVRVSQMEAQLNESSAAIRESIRSTRANLDLFSNSTIIESYLLVEDDEERYFLFQRPLLRLFNRYQDAYPQYYELRIILNDGYEDARLTTEELDNAIEEEGESEFFKLMSENSEDIYTGFNLNSDNNQISFLAAKRIRLEDRAQSAISSKPVVRGYLVVTSDIEFIEKQIRGTQIGGHGFLLFYDTKSNMLISPDSTRSTAEFARQVINQNSENIDASGIIETTWNNIPALARTTNIGDDMYLIAMLPEIGIDTRGQQMGLLISAITIATILLTTTILFFGLKKLLLDPIYKLNYAAQDIGRGNFKANIDLDSTDELGTLATTFRKMAESLHSSHERATYLAYHDTVTQLPNRLMFREYLDKVIAMAKRNGTTLGILFLDLDNFKHVNDTIGHDGGDSLIKEVANRLSGCLRQSDYIAVADAADDEADLVARLGGDEFILLLSDLTDTLDASIVAQRLMDAISLPYTIKGKQIHIGTSIGITIFPSDGDDAESLIRNADVAMYHAKENGKNNYKFYSHSLNQAASDRLTMENEIRNGLSNQEFVLFYQPIIDINQNRIVSAEALIRWQPPGKDLIPPFKFIPIAEESGLIIDIGEWVIGEACRQNYAWQQAGLPPISVSVNVSSVQIRHQNIINVIKQALESSGLESRYLDVELTESGLLLDQDRSGQALTALDEMGVAVSLDDFGTGYSSLSHLQRFPFKALKIDRSFVRDINTDTNDAAICSATIAMAKGLGIKVTAEGVEDENQLAFLKAHQCERIQGYYFSKPVPADEFVAFMREWNADNSTSHCITKA